MDPDAIPFDPRGTLSVENPAAAAVLLPLVPHCVLPRIVTQFVVALFHAVPGSLVALDVDASCLRIDHDLHAPAAPAEPAPDGVSGKLLHPTAYPYWAIPAFFNWEKRLDSDECPPPLALRFRNVNDAATASVCVRTAVVFEAQSLTLEGSVAFLGQALFQCSEIPNVLSEKSRPDKPGHTKLALYRVPPVFDVSRLEALHEFPKHNGFAVWRDLVELRLPPLKAGPLVPDNFFGQRLMERLVFHPRSNVTSLSASSFCFAYKLTRLDLRGCTKMTTFGNHCFQGCNALEVVCVRGLPLLESVGPSVFTACTALRLFDSRGCPNLIDVRDHLTRSGAVKTALILADPTNSQGCKVCTEAVDVPDDRMMMRRRSSSETDGDHGNGDGDYGVAEVPGAPTADSPGWTTLQCCCGTVRVPSEEG